MNHHETSPIVQVMFSFWSFEISEDILRNQKYLTLVRPMFWSHLDNTSLCIQLQNFCNSLWLHVAKKLVFLFSFAPDFRCYWAPRAHLNELPVKFAFCVNEVRDKLPTMYWLPELHKRPYKAIFIASSCTTTDLSELLTSCLTVIKSHFIRYCETVYKTSNKNWFWSIKILARCSVN